MNKEEILEKSRKENKNRDIYEQEITKQGNTIVCSTMAILATIFFIIQIFTGGGINYGLYAIVFCQPTLLYWTKWIKLRQPQQLAFVLLYTILVLLFSISHIYNLITAGTL